MRPLPVVLTAVVTAAGVAVVVLAGGIGSGDRREPVPIGLAWAAGYHCAEESGVPTFTLGFDIQGDRIARVDSESMAGFLDENGDRVPLATPVPSAVILAELDECLARYRLDDRAVRLALRDDRRELWSYYRAVAIPCLERLHGQQIVGFPERQQFLEGDGSALTPHQYLGFTEGRDPAEVERACPGLPPALASAPLGLRPEWYG